MREEFALAAAVDQEHLLIDQFGRRVAAGDFDHRRAGQQAIGQLLDLVREGGRKQQVLPLLGQHRDDLADIADEAHVEHAIGFVEHQDFHTRQVDRALLQVIEQPARGGDQDIDPVLQLADLRIDADAAEYHHRGQLGVLAVIAKALLDLGRQFAGRGQHQRANRRAALRIAHRRLVAQPLQDRQRKAGGLAGAGLGAAHQVATAEHGRNGLRLDRRGKGIAALGNGANE